jgi:hypothetical protein
MPTLAELERAMVGKTFRDLRTGEQGHVTALACAEPEFWSLVPVLPDGTLDFDNAKWCERWCLREVKGDSE